MYQFVDFWVRDNQYVDVRVWRTRGEGGEWLVYPSSEVVDTVYHRGWLRRLKVALVQGRSHVSYVHAIDTEDFETVHGKPVEGTSYVSLSAPGRKDFVRHYALGAWSSDYTSTPETLELELYPLRGTGVSLLDSLLDSVVTS
ncbi:MAG: hypothetical protein JSS66_05550 [Armatimonadetes bacterium]|nr:hypothetical protein [Armatimonadota bacterium]